MSEDTIVKGVMAFIILVPALIIIAIWLFGLEGEIKYLAILVLAFAFYVVFDQGRKLIAVFKGR